MGYNKISITINAMRHYSQQTLALHLITYLLTYSLNYSLCDRRNNHEIIQLFLSRGHVIEVT